MVPTLRPFTVTPQAAEPVGTRQRHPQGRQTMFRLIQVELNRPGRCPAAADDAPHIFAGVAGVDPAKALVGGVRGRGIQPRGGFPVRHLFEKPVLVIIALPDRVSEVIRKEQRIPQVQGSKVPVFAALPSPFHYDAASRRGKLIWSDHEALDTYSF
jgi:hypothetical protein